MPRPCCIGSYDTLQYLAEFHQIPVAYVFLGSPDFFAPPKKTPILGASMVTLTKLQILTIRTPFGLTYAHPPP